MQLNPGTRLRSVVCTTEIAVVKAPSFPIELTCGGALMVAIDAPVPNVVKPTAISTGTAIGKRYVQEDLDLEVLCTRSGPGDLEYSGKMLTLKGAKPLPSSD